MAFAKARLVAMSDSSGGGGQGNSSSFGQTSDPPPADEGFYVAFNPTTLKLTYTSTLEGGNARGKKQSQYIGKQSTDLAVELIFDTTDVDSSTVDQLPWGDADSRSAAQSSAGDVDVRIFTQKVAQMMGPKKPDEDKPAPPRVQFVWGSFLFEGVLKSLTETIDLFSAEGIPLRATLAVTLSEDALEFRRANAEGGSVAPLTTPQDGSTAATAASKAGLDPQAGKAIAALNGLDDLRSLPSGAALALPTVGASASIGFSASASASASIGASASAGIGVSAGASARASAGFGFSASASASASAGASFTGGFGGGAGLGVTIGGGGGFGLEAGAGASAGFGLSVGVSGGIGVSAGGGLSVSGGVAGGASASIALPSAGSVGGPGSGGSPGAQSVMDPSGRISRAPAAPRAPLPPPSTTSAGAAPTTRTSPTLAAPRPAAGTPSSPAAALGTSAVSVAAQTGGSRVAATIGLTAQTPLPGGASAASGAFLGISGVPRKTVRFGIAGPTLRALAYPRLPADDTCNAEDPNCPDPPAPDAAPRTRKRGARCGCGH